MKVTIVMLKKYNMNYFHRFNLFGDLSIEPDLVKKNDYIKLVLIFELV